MQILDPNASSPFIRTIEWEMLDKKKFFPLSIASSFTVRTTLYPFTLVKTRLQIQRGNEVYKGTWDAFRKIVKYEGARGLYKGFWVNVFSIVSGAFYVLTYENVRHILQANGIIDSRIRALIGGGCASLVGQTIIVPIDVISQRMMMVGQQVEGSTVKQQSGSGASSKGRTRLAVAITKDVYQRDGFRGFYRGYVASLFTYVPSSALWWTFYHLYQDKLHSIFPSWFSHLGIQCTSAILGGLTTTALINPLDIVRARLQVQRLDSINQTFRILWREEGLTSMFTKGLTARLMMSVLYSFSIIVGYESVKRFSVKEQYREQIRW